MNCEEVDFILLTLGIIEGCFRILFQTRWKEAHYKYGACINSYILANLISFHRAIPTYNQHNIQIWWS